MMGIIKANKKFGERENDAVSAVIGVILMVAITVAIAATIYVYVGGMTGDTPKGTPFIACNPDNVGNELLITVISRQDTSWTDINVSIIGGSVISYYTGSGYIIAGDIIDLSSYLTTNSSVTITFRYEPTNTLIGTWEVS
jgi:FlaG/FlaF family flagellin (archaellin)